MNENVAQVGPRGEGLGLDTAQREGPRSPGELIETGETASWLKTCGVGVGNEKTGTAAS